MINVVLKGVDEFLGSSVAKVISPEIANILNVSQDDVIVTCLHSIIYHNGIDQTSYNMLLTFELEEQYRSLEQKLVDYIFSVSRNFSVHCHINFSYLSRKTYSYIDNNYPLFVTESNEVVIEENDSEDEIYLGDMFVDFEDKIEKSNKR